MSDLTRFSVSLEADLLDAFDKFVRDGSFATRVRQSGSCCGGRSRARRSKGTTGP